jgi:hypothetical protein
MGVDYYNCEICNDINCEANLIYCPFCDERICYDCFKGEPVDENDLKCDENGYIKPDDYTCVSCDAIKQKKNKRNQDVILNNILKLVTVKKNYDKCKKLIEELKLK